MSEILSYAGYLLGLAVVFGVLALIGYVGISLRRAYEYGRRKDPRSKMSLLTGAIGLLVLSGGGAGVAYIDGKSISVLIYSGIVLAIVAFGWSGWLIVPEGLGD